MAINYDGNKPVTGSPPISGDMRDNFEGIRKALANRHNWSNTDETACTHKQFTESNIVTETSIVPGAVTESKIGNSAVSNTKLKQSTGSATGTIGLSSGLIITMNDYSLGFPNLASASNSITIHPYYATANPASQVGKFYIYNPSNTDSFNYWINWRYITASDNPFILVLKKDVEIVGVWESEDPPENLLGLKSDEIKKLDMKELPIFDSNANGIEIFYPCPKDMFKKLKEDGKKFKKSFFELIKEGNY